MNLISESSADTISRTPSAQIVQCIERMPCISNMSAMIWDTLMRLNYWKPIPGQGRLLAA